MSALHDLAAAYALDALDATERAAFETHLGQCGECRDEVAVFADAAAALGSAAASPPPERMRQAVLGSLTPVGPAVPIPTGRRRWLPIAASLGMAALLVAVAALAAGLVGVDRRADRGDAIRDLLAAPDARVVALAGSQPATARFVYSAEAGEGVFVVEGLADAGAGRTYQLWLIEQAGPVSAGLFEPDGGSATEIVRGDLSGAVAIALTREPDGGSPAPTGEVELAAQFD